MKTSVIYQEASSWLRTHMLLCLCASLPLYSQVTRSETLQEIYQAALASDPQLREAEARYNGTRETVALEKSARLPQIDGRASYNSSNTSHSVTSRSNSSDAAGVSLTLRQSLWNRSLGANIDRGRTEAEIAELQLENTRRSLITRSAEAYFNLLRSLDQRRTALNEEQTLNKQLEQTSERYEVGLVPINDLAEARAALDNAVASTIAANANVAVSSENLAVLTGRYPETIAPLSERFRASSLVFNDRDYWVRQALSSNLSLRISRLQLEVAELRHKANRANQQPELNGNLGYSYNRDLQDDSNSHTSSLGLELSVPFYGGGRFSAQRRQSAQGVIETRETLQRVTRSIRQQSRSLFLQVSSSRALIKARQQTIVSSQSALDAASAGYEAGTRDIVDLVNAQQKVFQAQRNYSDALYNYIINYLKLREVAGLLQERDLQSLEAVLDSEAQLNVVQP